MPTRRALLAGAGAAVIATPVARASDTLALTGRFQQGGHAIGRTWPGAHIFVDGEALTTASAEGRFIVGFDRDAPAATRIEARDGDRSARRDLSIAPGDFPSTRIDGLPSSTVEPSDPALLARIQEEIALKTEGFASRIDSDDFADGFVWPLETFRVSSRWGSQRVLNGTPARPHYGIDLAAPQGTPVVAPAAGRVVLARSLHLRGMSVVLDHGAGVVSGYHHLSALSVQEGQTVEAGQELGKVGATGLAGGPHLHWELVVNGVRVDPMAWLQSHSGP